MGNRTTAQAKSCTYYNQLIDKLNLKHKYEEIQVKDKVRFAYLKPTNEYMIEMIAWPELYPTEFNDIFQIDYEKMFEKAVLNPLKIFREINGWPEYNPTEEIEQDIFDL